MTWKNRTYGNDWATTLGYFIGFIIVCIGMGLLLSLPVMWLWNWLMPTIFGLTKITWLQSYGLTLLTSFLFKTSFNIDKK